MAAAGDVTYFYDANAHSDASNDIRTADTNIRNELDSIEGFANGKLATWSAKSQQQYRDAKDQWNKAADEMQNILAKAAPTLDNIHENYTAHDARVQKSFT
jgi:WXG100 family type VII secretion target